MTDDEWWAAQQRRDNQQTFRRIAEIRQPKRRYKFTPEQLAVALRWAEQKAAK